MDRHLEDLLSALNAHSVRYVVIGAYALAVHAQPRATKDLDIFIDRSATNAQAVYAALEAFGAPLGDVAVEDLQKPNFVIRFGVPPICIDIITGIDGVNFEAAWQSSAEHTVDGFTARYISAEEFIKNKLASGRLQDLADVEAVRRAQALKEKK